MLLPMAVATILSKEMMKSSWSDWRTVCWGLHVSAHIPSGIVEGRLTGIVRVVSCPQVGLPYTCLFQRPLQWGLMLSASLLRLCSTSDPLGSLVFCLFALDGCPVFLCFVHMLDTSFCREGVWASCSLLSCSVGCCGVGTPFALLASCCSSGSSVRNSSLYDAFSSKFVEPVHSMSSVAFLFVVQSSSILYPLLPLVGLTIVCLHVVSLVTSVHHLFVVECTCPFLVGHAHVLQYGPSLIQ